MRAALLAHEHRTAAGLFALLVLVYLWPVLVQGRVLAPTAELFHVAPWQAIAPPGIGRFINLDLGDMPNTYYPWDVLARQLIHAGTFPAWNPTVLGGAPLFANPELAWASPFALPLWILPLNYGLGVAAALKLWIASFGAYLLARELRLGFWPGILAGIAFGLCSFNVVWLSYGVFVSVAALLPWALWLAERIVKRGGAGDALALGGAVALILTGGHPGTQVHVLAAVGLYALVRLATRQEDPLQLRARRLGLTGSALALGALVAAVVLIPPILAAHDTVGADARAHGATIFRSAHIPFGALRTMLFPDWWGRPSESIIGEITPRGATAMIEGPSAYKDRTFYAGSAALVLAAIALVLPGGRRRKAPFALLGVLGAAIALRTPGLYDLVLRLPGFDRVQNGRIYLWVVLSISLLAAFGLQALLDRGTDDRRVWGVLGAALLAAPIAMASIHFEAGTLSSALDHVVRRTSSTPVPALALASALWYLLFVGALAVLLVSVGRSRRRRPLLGGLIALLLALDMLHFAHGYQPMGPASSVIPGRTGAIAFLQRHAGNGRIAGTEAFPANWSTVYGLRDVRGSEDPQPTRRFAHVWHLDDPSIRGYGELPMTSRTPKISGLLGARYLIANSEADQLGNTMRLVYRGRDARVFANPLALPRAFVAQRVRIVGSENAEVAGVAARRFDARTEAIVRADELAGAGTRGTLASAGSARVVREENASVTLRATLKRPGVVVLDDQLAPGWTVRVDGRPARALRTDVILRGVVVPAGTHEIVWSYRVPGLRAGAALSGLGMLAALAWGGALVIRARRRRGEDLVSG